MDDPLRDFLMDRVEHLDAAAVELASLGRGPDAAARFRDAVRLGRQHRGAPS